MSKVHPLVIEPVCNTDGDPVGWRSKGHHDPVVFLNAVNAYEISENDNDDSLDLVNEEDVKHSFLCVACDGDAENSCPDRELIAAGQIRRRKKGVIESHERL